MIREVVDDAAHGSPTVLTHYKREVAAIVPLAMVHTLLESKSQEIGKVPRPSPSTRHRARQTS